MMSSTSLRAFELDIIQGLLQYAGLETAFTPTDEHIQSIEFSGCGYFLTLKDASLPTDRRILDSPPISGKLGDIDVGFVIFIENQELTLECYTYGEEEFLPQHREQAFEIAK